MEVRVHAAAPQTKARRSLVENVCTFSIRRTSVSRSNRRLTLLPPATLSHRCWQKRSASTDRTLVVLFPGTTRASRSATSRHVFLRKLVAGRRPIRLALPDLRV